MRKIIAAIICSLLLPEGVVMASSACDKKEDKKEQKDQKKDPKKDGKEDGDNKPVVIVTWEDAWIPIYQ